MAKKTINKVWQLRVRECPELIHLKIEKFMRDESAKRDQDVTKEIATIELLSEATRNIKLPA